MNSDKSIVSYHKTEGSNGGSSKGSALIVLAIVLLSLILLKYEISHDIKTVDKPVKNRGVERSISTETASKETTAAAMVNIKAQINEDNYSNKMKLKQIIEASKKVPFKARITTEAGFKGFWAQNGCSYRFENPAKSQTIIFNATKKRLWVVDQSQKIAFETKFNEQSANAYADYSPAMFIEALSESTDTSSKALEDILPSGPKAKLTFNAIGLPKRWEGQKSDGSLMFITWDYFQIAETPAEEFDLPAGIAIKNLTSTDLGVIK